MLSVSSLKTCVLLFQINNHLLNQVSSPACMEVRVRNKRKCLSQRLHGRFNFRAKSPFQHTKFRQQIGAPTKGGGGHGKAIGFFKSFVIGVKFTLAPSPTFQLQTCVGVGAHDIKTPKEERSGSLQPKRGTNPNKL